MNREAEEEDGEKRGEDDAERHGEALEDVVGVLDHDRNEETAQRLIQHHQGHQGRPRKKRALLGDLGSVVESSDYRAKESAKKPKLDVSCPQGNRTPLEHLLKVNASETARYTGT